MLRLGRRHREDIWPQCRLLEPSRNQLPKDPRPALPASLSGNYQYAAPPYTARLRNEGGQGLVRFSLCHSMQIEPCLDPMQPAFQPFCIGAVDPGKTIERRHLRQPRRDPLRPCQRNSRDRLRGARRNRPLTAQRPHIAKRFCP